MLLRVVLDEVELEQAVFGSPTYRKRARKSEIWYSVMPAAAESDICPACYMCFYDALRAGHIWQPKPADPGQLQPVRYEYGCSLCCCHVRKTGLANDSGDF